MNLSGTQGAASRFPLKVDGSPLPGSSAFPALTSKCSPRAAHIGLDLDLDTIASTIYFEKARPMWF
jgi:hypothetical protein